METILESSSQGDSHEGNPSPFHSLENICAPYMEMLCLLGFTIGLLVWLF